MKNILNKRNQTNVLRFILTSLISSWIVTFSFGQNADNLKLKDYRPVSIYKVPVTHVAKAKYPVIDAHVHPCHTDKEIQACIKIMDDCGIEKAFLMTGASGARFDSIAKLYAKYGNRFELWCGFDYTGYNKPGYGPDAAKELERCFKNGARGVGELMYKGKGIPPSATGRSLMLPDDPRVDILFEKCAELGMPVNLHMSEDKWMYEKIDSTNDGLMNASSWQIKMENGARTHEELLEILDKTVKTHPKTTFIAAHLADCCADLSYLGNLFDKYPNLYADISARFGEISPIPRFAHDFIEKYQDRIVYAADMFNFDENVYRGSFRILETADEHFYDFSWSQYHWALYGLSISDSTLKKMYRENIIKLMNQKGI